MLIACGDSQRSFFPSVMDVATSISITISIFALGPGVTGNVLRHSHPELKAPGSRPSYWELHCS